jgi:DNA-binding IclR family transcriptional regulator
LNTQEVPSGYRERNSTADRALAILGMFSDQQTTLSATDVSKQLDVARSTAYRYLQSLVRAGYLAESPGGYELGPKILELGRLARRGHSIIDLAGPYMRTLAEEFGQTVLLTRRVGSSIVCIDRREATGQRVRISYEPGTVLPINAGASAFCLLAWLPEPAVRRLLGHRRLEVFTENTLTDLEAIIEKLKEIRKVGYAMSVAEVDPDVIGIGAPVFGADGEVQAGLSIVGLHARISVSERESMASGVLEVADLISRELVSFA